VTIFSTSRTFSRQGLRAAVPLAVVREREREREREGERERESNILGCICMYIYTHARAHTHTHTHTYTVDWQSPETEHRRAEEFVAEEFVEGSNAATARRKSHLYVCIYVYRYV